MPSRWNEIKFLLQAFERNMSVTRDDISRYIQTCERSMVSMVIDFGSCLISLSFLFGDHVELYLNMII